MTFDYCAAGWANCTPTFAWLAPVALFIIILVVTAMLGPLPMGHYEDSNK
jgi:nitrogen fixation-related uncharacterized protein